MAKVPNGIETLPKISIVWVGRTNVTDRRQTDGRRHIANMNLSSRLLKMVWFRISDSFVHSSDYSLSWIQTDASYPTTQRCMTVCSFAGCQSMMQSPASEPRPFQPQMVKLSPMIGTEWPHWTSLAWRPWKESCDDIFTKLPQVWQIVG